MPNRILVPNLYGRVGDEVAQLARSFGDITVVCPTRIETMDVDGHTLLVTDQLPKRRDLHVLLAQGASGFKAIPAQSREDDNRLVILVPFGSGESGRKAMLVAVQVVKRLKINKYIGTELLFYHTTWRKPGEHSEDGWKHLSDDARNSALALMRIAAGNELPYRYQIDICASTVPGGIITCALTHEVGLIVMARGSEVRVGSYVDQMIELSPVPLLIAQQEVA